MNVFFGRPFYKIQDPFNEILLLLVVCVAFQEDGDCVLFDAYLLEDSNAKSLIDGAILLIVQNFNHLMDRSGTIHHYVFNSF